MLPVDPGQRMGARCCRRGTGRSYRSVVLVPFRPLRRRMVPFDLAQWSFWFCADRAPDHRRVRRLGCSAVQPCAQPRPPGTEILDAETKRQKSSFKRANARRDQNPGTEWPEIPAETRYSASCRKRAVCKDWVVVCAVICEPVSLLYG